MSEPAARSGEPAPQKQDRPTAAVDIQQLAERVYRLMLADLRLERARGERPVRRKAR
jgi:hypothetical protein